MIEESDPGRVRVKIPGDHDRNTALDLLRGAAILVVIGLHWSNSHLPAPPDTAWDRAFNGFAGHGGYGVEMFFVLSGFLITRAAMQRQGGLFGISIRDFYLRRCARIQPLYIAAVCFGLVLVFAVPIGSAIYHYTFRDPAAVYGGEFIASLFSFSYNWEMIAHRHEFQFRGLHWDVMWSLAVEEQFYLAFPLLILWARNRRRLTIALIAVAVAGLAARVAADATHAGLLMKFNSFSGFGNIALGVLCALWRDALRLSAAVSNGLIVAGTAVIAAACFHGGVAPIILGAVLFVIGAGETLLFRHRLWRVPARIGQLSYGLYLLQAGALLLAAPILGGQNLVAGFLILAATAYVMAEISSRCFEAPINNWARARLRR
jgi:peptidoglycan/LPS O-acetylase OafA/YrhL